LLDAALKCFGYIIPEFAIPTVHFNNEWVLFFVAHSHALAAASSMTFAAGSPLSSPSTSRDHPRDKFAAIEEDEAAFSALGKPGSWRQRPKVFGLGLPQRAIASRREIQTS